MADEKTMATGNENEDIKKEQGTNPETPADNKEETKEGVFKKIGNGFKKHGKKIGLGLGLAAAFAGGLMVEKVGLPSFKKKDEPASEEAAE